MSQANFKNNRIRLTDNERLELWGMRHSFAKTDVSRAVTEFAHGISDLLQYGDPIHVYRALSGIEQVKAA